VGFNVNWAAQEVPFPQFGLQLRDGQSVKDFIKEVEKKVNAMIGESTMNEYKAYKNLVKHKRRINRVFSEVCGKKVFLISSPRHSCEGSCCCRGQLLGRTFEGLKKRILEER
jgi:hypothetical protein